MQTFLPYKEPLDSALVLDYKRLGKQRVEAVQILKTLLELNKAGWRNHPAVLMWEGYEKYLNNVYLKSMIYAWGQLGYKNTKTLEHYHQIKRLLGEGIGKKPNWITQEFCDSHKSNLKRKFPEYYGKIWPDIPDDLPYIWPTKK